MAANSKQPQQLSYFCIVHEQKLQNHVVLLEHCVSNNNKVIQCFRNARFLIQSSEHYFGDRPQK